MKILCVIPARGKSKRIKNKNIRQLAGRPLIYYAIKTARESRLCAKVVVSTDDKKIAAAAKKYGVDVVMRPDELAGDNSPIDASLRHCVTYFSERGFLPDIVVLLQANVPVRKKGEIDAVIKRLIKNKKASSVATAYVVDQRPEWAKVIDKKTGKFKPYLKPSNLYRKQDLPELYLLDGAVIVVRTGVLLETEGVRKIHGYMGDDVYPFIHDKKYAVEVDEPQDFSLAQYYLKRENE